MPPKSKVKNKKEAVVVTSTRTETSTGSHVTTVVTSNDTSNEVAEAVVTVTADTAAVIDWLAEGRNAWKDDKSNPERRVVIKYSSYKKEFACRGPWGAVRW
jgi:hypothetical protein